MNYEGLSIKYFRNMNFTFGGVCWDDADFRKMYLQTRMLALHVAARRDARR